MHPFTYTVQTSRVLFGAGTLGQLASEVARLGAGRALVLCTPEQRELAERAVSALGAMAGTVFDQAVMHVPMETVRGASAVASQCEADCIVAIGGGSTIGLGKALALDSAVPVVAIPTTYSGSEMTPIYGITANGLKTTGRDVRVLPRTVLYDPTLTLSLPIGLSVVSGINAMAHAAEGLYAADGNPIMSLMAVEGINALRTALPALRADARNLQARTQALYGSWLCGVVLGNVSMALHHKLCHTLGGSFNLPHAETHTVVLPHALAYNAAAAPEAMRRLSGAMQAVNGAQAMFDFARDNGAPVSLREIGMSASGLELACETALKNQYPNPRPLDRQAIRVLLQDAFEGRRPA